MSIVNTYNGFCTKLVPLLNGVPLFNWAAGIHSFCCVSTHMASTHKSRSSWMNTDVVPLGEILMISCWSVLLTYMFPFASIAVPPESLVSACV